MGHALVELDQFDAADEAYWEALAIWKHLDLPNMAAETRAGLARRALRQQEAGLALRLVDDILLQAEVEPGFDGAELPVRIYLTAYQVLQSERSPRAASVPAHRALLALEP